MASNEVPTWHGTTILTVRKGGTVVVGGDGQVSIGQTIVKANAKKVRKLGKGDVIGGFAGATADAFHFVRAAGKQARAVSRPATARLGRTRQGLAHRPLFAPAGSHDDRRRRQRVAGADRHRRRARAGNGRRRHRLRRQLCARLAARALDEPARAPRTIVRKSLDIAADICVYTNRNVTHRVVEGACLALNRAGDIPPL